MRGAKRNLQDVALELTKWSRKKYGSIGDKIKSLMKEIQALQNERRGGVELKLARHSLEVL